MKVSFSKLHCQDRVNMVNRQDRLLDPKIVSFILPQSRIISTLYPPCIMCVQYIGGCSVHRGVFSTSGGVQYIGGIP